ncbi:MAG: phosphoribosyltransferase family protein [Bacteriovoracia bacterium]
MEHRFQDRAQAGRLLARALTEALEAPDESGASRLPHLIDAWVLALPRGGVPVAFEVAQALSLPLAVLAVKKIGAPDEPEYGIGAIAEDGFYWIDPIASRRLGYRTGDIERILLEKNQEIGRQIENYRGGRSLPPLQGKTVILVDDGLATGVTARVAAQYVRACGAKYVLLAVPVGAAASAMRLRASDFDEVVCLNEAPDFEAVGQYYDDFHPVTDTEILEKLGETPGIGADAMRADSEIPVPIGRGKTTPGWWVIPRGHHGLVIFAHGSGSSRLSPRNRAVASALNRAGFATLLFDLLTEPEATKEENVFDVEQLAARLVEATRWAKKQERTHNRPIGYFGASTGAAAALVAASTLSRDVCAVVSRGGRPDLARNALTRVTAPTLLIVGSLDREVLALNREALGRLPDGQLAVIPGAGHLFEEPGAIEQVSHAAAPWFKRHFANSKLGGVCGHARTGAA